MRKNQTILAGIFLLAIAAASMVAPTSTATAEDSAPLYVPANAHGLATDPLPSSTRLAGPNEFSNMYKKGILALDIPSRAATDLRKFQDDARQIEANARVLFSQTRAVLLDRILRIRSGIDVPYAIINSRGERQVVQVLGREATLFELVTSQAVRQTKENAKALYDHLQARLAGQPNLPIVDASVASVEELRAANILLLSQLDAVHGKNGGMKGPAGYGQCDAEEGAGEIGSPDDGDQIGKSCNPSAVGLLAGADWTLKPFTTCVRNQGERGTAAAFALIGAIETRVAREDKRFANLSEQHLFNQMKMLWHRTPADLGESFSPIFTTNARMAVGYQFHFEDIWSYNASLDRIVVPGPLRMTYQGSCQWYDGRHCSETNHQGQLICAIVGGYRYCGYHAPMPMATPIALRGMSVIMDVNAPDASLNDARRLVRAGTPVVMSFILPQSFATVSADGYIPTVNEVERIDGAHYAVITGWLPNEFRPSGAPEAAGGGYFIVKNSWGKCAGDAGYYYVAYDWVKARAINLVAVF